MIMNNDIFSPSRLSTYIAAYFGENKKKLLQMYITVIGVMIFCIAIFPILNGNYYRTLPYDTMWAKETSVCWVILYAIIFSAAAAAFTSYDNKEKRIYSLTFPVSTLEKYLTYLLFYCAAIYVVFFTGLIIGDYIRVWTAPLYAATGAVIKPLPMMYFFTWGYGMNGHLDDSEQVAALQMFAYSSLITIQAFFVLAASIWPKQARLRGILSVVSINIALIVISSLSMKLVVAIHGINFIPSWLKHESFDINIITFLTTGYIISTLAAIGMYLLAYLRFKEMETIERW